MTENTSVTSLIQNREALLGGSLPKLKVEGNNRDLGSLQGKSEINSRTSEADNNRGNTRLVSEDGIRMSDFKPEKSKSDLNKNSNNNSLSKEN